MTIEELNRLVEQAYEAAFAFERRLTDVYVSAYARQTRLAASRFEAVTAAWTPPVYQSLSDGMNEQEAEEADSIRDEAALAIIAILSAAGIAASSREFMEAISQRAQANFEQEILRQLRKVVQESFDAGLSTEETAAAIRAQIEAVIPSSAEMLAQTELTALVNERGVAAAQKQFPGGVSKTWLTVGDNRVRAAHAKAQGQTVPIDQPFQIGGSALMYPGDPSGPLRLVARCRCRLSFTNDPATITAAARPDVSELAMVAVYPTAEEAEKISTAGGNPPETMHVTMVFLGEVDNFDMDAAIRAVSRVARTTEPMSGRVGGVGMFAPGPDGTPLLAIPNVRGLAELRTRLTDALAAEDVESPSEHDWVPHMTLAYVDEPEMPDLSVIGSPLTFDTLSLVVADERTDFQLGTLVASAQEDTLMSMEPLTTNITDAGGAVVGEMTWTSDHTGGIGDNSSWRWKLSPNSVLEPGMYYYLYPDLLTAGVTITVSEDGEVEEAEPMADGPRWRALLAIEGVETEDGRMLAEGSLTWRDLPLTLTAMDTSQHGAEGEAKVAGRIDRIWRDAANQREVWGEGVFNGDEFGLHIAELVGNQSLRGNSIEPAVLAYEIRNRETGEVLEGDEILDAIMNDVPLLTVFLEAVIMASTVVPTPALGDANIVLASGLLRTTWFQEQPGETLTASAAGMAPLHPPAEWFDDPRLSGPTPLTVTDDGKVFGHAALWNSCHIAEPNGPGVCVPPPRSGLSYECFHHGAVKTAEGHDVAVGQITMSTFHAGSDLGWKAAREHYEHTGAVVADVRAGEDRHGIWVSGALRPDLPAAKVREMKAGSISGDWRQVIGRGLEFIGALIVNIGGFPIPRPSAHIVASAAGEEEVLSLVAAGIVEPSEEVEGMSRREYLRKIRALTS